MNKRCVLFASLLVLLAVLTGCRCKHDWSDATCTEAGRCRFCGAHRGDALGHSFQEATCQQAKTCTACGLKEGEALSHEWKEATCAKGEFCLRCGETKSEPLAHSWVEATCDKPRHCSVCGAVDGRAVGHSWLDATCTTPKTCSICAGTEGDALGHSWTKATCLKPQSCLLCGLWGTPALGHSWLEATCTEPVRCEYCDVAQGEPMGHDWQDATPEKAKTCLTCGLEEGLPIELDDRFIPEHCQVLFGSWQYTQITTAEELNVPGFDRDLEETITYTFGIYGELKVLTKVVDPECYKELLVADAVAKVYAGLAEQGMDEAAADAFWMAQYEKTILQYQQELIESTVTENDMDILDDYVYYVMDDAVCISMHWEDYFAGHIFTIEDDTLTMTNELTGEVLILIRVS